MSLSKSLGAAEAVGFEVRDVESLREHYAMTLRQWCGDLRPMPTRRGRLQTRPLIESGESKWPIQHTNFDLGRLISHHILLAKPQHGNRGMRRHVPIGTTRASILASKATTIGVDLAALHLSGLSNALGIAGLCVLKEAA